jgi:hypothetical protein
MIEVEENEIYGDWRLSSRFLQPYILSQISVEGITPDIKIWYTVIAFRIIWEVMDANVCRRWRNSNFCFSRWRRPHNLRAYINTMRNEEENIQALMALLAI